MNPTIYLLLADPLYIEMHRPVHCFSLTPFCNLVPRWIEGGPSSVLTDKDHLLIVCVHARGIATRSRKVTWTMSKNVR